jgi:hypothetical protein
MACKLDLRRRYCEVAVLLGTLGGVPYRRKEEKKTETTHIALLLAV